MSLIDDFKSEVSKSMIDSGVLGQDANNAKKIIDTKISEFSEEKETELKSEYPKYVDYLEKPSDLVKVAKIMFSNTKSVKTKRTEVKKFLKDPKEIDDFFRSILDTKPKKETKEAMSTGGGYAAMDVPLFSKMETKEATSSSSVGTYDANSFQDIKMKGNTTKGKGRSWKKTQIPGGRFVQVKDKCKKFPYCNQGDIKALKIFKEEAINTTIEKMCLKYGIDESEIREIILKEFKQ